MSRKPRHAELFVHIFTDGDDDLVETLRPVMSVDPRIVSVESNRIAHWTVRDEDARDRALVNDVVGGDVAGVRSPPLDYWPRATIADSPAIELPSDLFDPSREEIVSSPTGGLWMHFVEETWSPSRRDERREEITLMRRGTGPRGGTLRVFSVTYEFAVADGVWGIEEGTLEGENEPLGWFVTKGRAFDAIPLKLHSIL